MRLQSQPPYVRVVSLAPSTTTTITRLGATDLLVGTTRNDIEGAQNIGGWLTPDFQRVDRLEPDIVFTADELQSDIRDELEQRGHTVCHVDPRTLGETLETVETIGRKIGAEHEATELRKQLQARLDDVSVESPERTPTVYCEEWPNPPMAAGNWVPEMVRTAGGEYPFVNAGERSQAVDAQAVQSADPDVIVLHYCGDNTTGVEEFRARGWDITRDIRVVDDNLFNQPSPTLIDGVEYLAKIIDEVR